MHDRDEHRRRHRGAPGDQPREPVEALADTTVEAGPAEVVVGDPGQVGGGEHVQPRERLARRRAPGRQQPVEVLGDPQRAGEHGVGDAAVVGQLGRPAVQARRRAGRAHGGLGGRRGPPAPVRAVVVHPRQRLADGVGVRGDAGQAGQGLQRVGHGADRRSTAWTGHVTAHPVPPNGLDRQPPNGPVSVRSAQSAYPDPETGQ